MGCLKNAVASRIRREFAKPFRNTTSLNKGIIAICRRRFNSIHSPRRVNFLQIEILRSQGMLVGELLQYAGDLPCLDG